MKPSALIVTSSFALLLGACSEDFGVIEVTATRVNSMQTMQIEVCSQAQGDCAFGSNNTYTADPFNSSSSDKQTIAIKAGDHTLAGTLPTELTLIISAQDSSNADLSMNSDPGADCAATVIPIKSGTTYKLTASLNAADVLTLSCAGGDMGGGTCQILSCDSVTGFGVIPDLSTPDASTDGGI